MIKHIFYFLLSCTPLWGCTEAPDSVSPNHSGLVAVEISLTPEKVRPVSRATDESTIKDVNLFLFGKTNGQRYRIYTQTQKLRLECVPGEYDLYVVANYHVDMGDKTPAELAGFKIPYKWTYADLPMSACDSVTISASKGGAVTLPTIEVRRNVAKVAYNIAVAKSVSDIRLVSATVYSMPLRSTLLSNSIPSTANADYTNGPLTEISGDRYSGTIYMFENCQGRVSSITSQDQKNSTNAPKFASYLLIRATRGGKVLDYKIYLGENNTDDFNVRRNTSHTLNVTILGDNEVDARVHSYTLEVYDDLEKYSGIGGGYCSPSAGMSLMIDIKGNSHNLNFSGELEILKGNSAAFEFARDSNYSSYHSFDFYSLTGLNYYEINYLPSLITEEESELRYIVTITDEYDFWQSCELTHRFANNVVAYTQNSGVPNGKGSITASNVLYTEKVIGTENIRALCYEDGCTFRATPATGYKFSGWYSDSAFTKLLSTDGVCNFKPTSAYSWLYAKFEVDKTFVEILTNIWDVKFTCEKSYTTDQDRESFTVPYGSRCTITVDTDVPLFSGWYDAFSTTNRKLISAERTYSFTATDDMTLALGYINSTRLDAAGSANCYIAQPAGGFRFNAMIMGNGKATTGITPKRLSGNSAKVIWETGSTRGAVIKEAAYSPNNGLISFTMGGSQGNALIGLFDQNDVCVWSWHIWATAYNPKSGYHAYKSMHGDLYVMDRNLGALSGGGYEVNSRGLYYQWGRKDPFIHPESLTSSRQYPTVYYPGYDFDVTEPMMGYGAMTLDYAIAHPWAFMCGVYYGNDRDEDTPNWLSTQNPNLWGNTSTMIALSDTDEKSIYDPCPPGWRVPDRRTFVEAGLSKHSSYPSQFYSLYYNVSENFKAIYPMSGYMNAGTFYTNGSACYVWTNAPAQYGTGTNYYKHYSTVMSVTSSGIELLGRMSRDKALPVRCVRDN